MRFFIGGILGLVSALSVWANDPPRSWDESDSIKTLHQASTPLETGASFVRAIGVSLDSNTNGIVITEVFVGMPAYSAGLCKGDKLVAINNRPIVSLLNAIAQTQNIKADVIMVDVQRKDMRICRRVEVRDGRPQFIGAFRDGRTLSVAVSAFARSTSDEFSDIVKLYAPSELDTMIIDLRSTAGGSRLEAQKIARLLGGSHNRRDQDLKIIVLQNEIAPSAVAALADMLVQQRDAEVWGKTVEASTAPEVAGSGGSFTQHMQAVHGSTELEAPVKWNMADFRERHPVPTTRAQDHPMMIAHNNIASLVWGINGNAFAAMNLVRSAF